MYAPSHNLSIDEQMVGTKSRVSFLQYMPKKPNKFGIKLWALCEAVSEYCLQFQIYTGKLKECSEHGLSHRVVFDLMTTHLDKGFRLFFDNFYTSFTLVKDLLLRNTLAYGTIRVGRGKFPANFKTEKLEKGMTKYIENENIVAVHWKDKRDVFVMSSFHGNEERKISRYQDEISKTEMICDYNNNMLGVDKCDQFLAYYNIDRTSFKWWKKYFFE